MMRPEGDLHTKLTKTLRRGQHVGIIGGDIADHVSHAMAWIDVVGPLGAAFCVDLGTGAGLPGLALALANTESHWLLTESRGTRVTFVRSAVRQLELQERVTVWDRDVQEAAHQAAYRSHATLVTARAFGSPAITAECATAFLETGGRLVVSEPPANAENGDGEDDDGKDSGHNDDEAVTELRWPAEALRGLGLAQAKLQTETYRFAVMTRAGTIDDSLPRRRPAMERSPRF